MKRVAATALVAVLIAVVGAAGMMATARPHAAASAYVVRAGDTLSGIATRFGTTADAIARANGVTDPNLILVGQHLTIPSTDATPHSGGLPAKLLAHPERLRLRPVFEWWAAYYRIPADLIEGLGWIESGWQRNVISKTGAQGIGQLMPATVEVCWKLIGIPLDPMNASDNIRMTARFLRYLLDATGGVVSNTLAAYYQGLRAVRQGPILPETLIYVATILAVRPAFR